MDTQESHDHGTGKLGFVLSGGGGRGAFEAGVLQRLGQEPSFREPAVIAGTSAGAINAALFASGKSPEAIRDFWFELGAARVARTNDAFFHEALVRGLALVGRSPLRTLKTFLNRVGEHRGLGGPLSNFVELLLSDRFDLLREWMTSVRASYVVDTTRLRELLVREFGGEVVRSERAALAINVVDARSNQVVRFVNRPIKRSSRSEYVVRRHITVDMVLASTSIPIFFPAISHERRLLWDGGVLSNTPMAPAAALGAERIVTVLVTHDSVFSEPSFANLGQAFERLFDMLLENAYNVDRRLLLARNKIAELEGGSRYRRIHLYEPIRPARDSAFDAGSIIDFDGKRLAVLYAHGQSAAAAWLRRGPLEDREREPTPANRSTAQALEATGGAAE